MTALSGVVVWQQIAAYCMRKESAKREELFQIVTENAADMIALVDVKGNRLYNSPAYKRILGYSAAELGETSAFEQIHIDDRFKVLEAAQQARTTGVGKTLEYRIRHKNGTWRVLESIAGTIRDEKGEVTKLVIVNRDISERKRAEEQAQHNSFHDGLTGLPNRRLLLDRLRNLFDRARRDADFRYTLLFVDLDGFKRINDTMGPAIGDRVIMEVAKRLESCLRHEDLASDVRRDFSEQPAVFSRVGGDEFTVLFEAISDAATAMRIGHRIMAVLGTTLLVDGREVQPSASIGIALSATGDSREDELLQNAELAMRRAKAMGGGRCEVFDETLYSERRIRN